MLRSLLGLAAAATLGCSAPMALHAPACAPIGQRAGATAVELSPIALAPGAAVAFGRGDWSGTNAAAVVSSGMASELAARTIQGGAPGGYVARCALDRIALRRDADMAETRIFTTMYVDLACEAARGDGGALVWRGELRGRGAATDTRVLEGEDAIVQKLADRMLADVTREMTSDLVVRALGLTSTPSQREFEDEAAQHETAGVDDLALAPIALGEDPARIPPLLPGAGQLAVGARAALWNAIALSVGPGDAWPAGDKLRLDDEDFVRFYQYKALARLASGTALAQLRAAEEREPSPLLAELVRDALSTGGIGLARGATNASAVTNGTTTSP